MGRPWREEYKGGIYHVMARGNNKEYIFKESIDKGYFIKLLKECSSSMGCVIYGYVLMDNHYHILIQTMDKQLQEIMHQINNRYSKYFNFKYKRVGHVFQGRYKASVVQDERYMIAVLRYIHQNPVKAGMCTRVEAYKWSSDIYYRKGVKGFVDTSMILEMLDKSKDRALTKYIEFMEEADETDYDNINIVGEEAYQIIIQSKRNIVTRKRLDEILIETGLSINEYNSIKQGSRKRNLTEYKLKYIQSAIEHKYTFSEIGKNINISDSGVKDIIERHQSKLITG